MNELIKEFKIYCETVEDIAGLEIIKTMLFESVLNLETFIDDNLEKTSNKSEEIEEAKRLMEMLNQSIKKAKNIEDTNLRDIWKLIKNDSKEDLKIKLEWLFQDCCSHLCCKYKIKLYPYGYERDLKDEEIDKWYSDLFDIFSKHKIGY